MKGLAVIGMQAKRPATCAQRRCSHGWWPLRAFVAWHECHVDLCPTCPIQPLAGCVRQAWPERPLPLPPYLQAGSP